MAGERAELPSAREPWVPSCCGGKERALADAPPGSPSLPKAPLTRLQRQRIGVAVAAHAQRDGLGVGSAVLAARQVGVQPRAHLGVHAALQQRACADRAEEEGEGSEQAHQWVRRAGGGHDPVSWAACERGTNRKGRGCFGGSVLFGWRSVRGRSATTGFIARRRSGDACGGKRAGADAETQAASAARRLNVHGWHPQAAARRRAQHRVTLRGCAALPGDPEPQGPTAATLDHPAGQHNHPGIMLFADPRGTDGATSETPSPRCTRVQPRLPERQRPFRAKHRKAPGRLVLAAQPAVTIAPAPTTPPRNLPASRRAQQATA